MEIGFSVCVSINIENPYTREQNFKSINEVFIHLETIKWLTFLYERYF